LAGSVIPSAVLEKTRFGCQLVVHCRTHLGRGPLPPITRYLIRISADRYSGDPERSNQLCSENPLSWDEIDLHAWRGQGRFGSMGWTAHRDRDAFKEIWLLFAGEYGHFPLCLGECCWIE